MASQNLRAVIRLKTMAHAAAEAGDANTPDVGGELAATYERLRLEAMALAERAGWNTDDSFDRELPPLGNVVSSRRLPRGMASQQGMVNALAKGQRARVLLGQLAAWAEGYQEVFELEERFKADAEAKREAEAKKAKDAGKRPPGFTPD
jgi:hypothetical protein